MAAIIRVKRRNSVEPQDALLIACKRSKIDTDDEEPLTTLVKLAGTVKNQDEDAIEKVTKQFANKQELQDEFKKHKVDILSKMRDEVKAQSRESRYKIINFQRSLGDKQVDQDNQVTTVIDIEDSQNMKKADKEETDYVYDIYMDPTMMIHKQISEDHQIAVYPYALDCELVFDNDPDCEDVGEDEYKTDDENSENNYRNFYPDNSESDSDAEDMKLAMENLSVGEDLSSEEDFAYGLNEDDVNNYGHHYAKYKAKVRKELGEGDSEDEYKDCEGSEKSDHDYDDAESDDD